MRTVGHSTLPIDLFLSILKANEVHSLVDIRSIPKSRYNPQFAQENLAPALEAAGIEYRWQRSLGGLRHPRKDSINLGWRVSSFRGYADYMQTPEFQVALDELLAIAGEFGTVIMCAEAVPWRCHRSLVSDALTARSVAVEHIFYDAHGNSHRKPHELTSFARLDGTRVWYPKEDDLFAAISPSGGDR
jgi:uncharacterized protein (DUF488 family)